MEHLEKERSGREAKKIRSRHQRRVNALSEKNTIRGNESYCAKLA